jgi:dipeptidase D
MMLCLADEGIAEHPALELLFTVSEELGMVGADNLDPQLVTGRSLLNLDSDHEGLCTVGCAGGVSVNLELPVNREVQGSCDTAYEIQICGLLGGHSAEDIDKGRANANVLVARVLDALCQSVEIRLSSLSGGTARNAIPRKANALIVCPAGQEQLCRKAFTAIRDRLLLEYENYERGLSIAMECGIISDRCGGLDAVSIGPKMEGLHSPDERVSMSSVSRTFDFLLALLASL